MTTKEIKEKESEALEESLIERRKHLFELRSQAITEKLENPRQIGNTKKDIARIKTILRQRAIETETKKPAAAK